MSGFAPSSSVLPSRAVVPAWAALIGLCSLFALACSGDGGKAGGDGGGGDGSSNPDDSGDGGDGTDGGTALDPVCTEATEPACVDAMILNLSLHDDKVSEGEVVTTADGADFLTLVDATAGGYNAYTRNAWTYVKFTPEGAVRVDIDDETALESLDWDLSLRRYLIRMNSGVSGPSCVGAASLSDVEYEDVTEIPAGVTYDVEDFYDEACDLRGDQSGLPDSPDVQLGDWWTYNGQCVATTGIPHLVQLADGHILKLRVEAYYGTGQEECNSSGKMGEDSAMISLRWQMLN